jgi:hypothetical protein
VVQSEVSDLRPRRYVMTATISQFEPVLAPCGKRRGGERFITEDLQGLVTEDLRYSCGCRSTKEEFHDGSVHRMIVDHHGRILLDEELRGE